MHEPNIVFWPITRLTPYAKNSRTHSDDQISKIAASITTYGFTSPILVDDNYGILAGHGRLAASKLLGLEEVPVIVLTGLSEVQKRAYVIADNKLAEEAGWDTALLAEELTYLKDQGATALAGFTDEEVNSFFDSLDAQAATLDDDAKPAKTPSEEALDDGATPSPLVSRLGTLWTLGEHKLLCGDSTKKADFLKVMCGSVADLVLTDPPYNVAYTGRSKKRTEISNDEMDPTEFTTFLTSVFKNLYAYSKPTAPAFVWYAGAVGNLFNEALLKAKYTLDNILIWKKSHFVVSFGDYHNHQEPCLYAYKQPDHTKPPKGETTVYHHDKPSKSEFHPTMKPVPLFEQQIKQMTKKADVVVDCFGGSGTTLIACENTGRIARLIELDPKYCDVIVKRWQDLTGLEAKDQDGKTFNATLGDLKNETAEK